MEQYASPVLGVEGPAVESTNLNTWAEPVRKSVEKRARKM